MRVASNSSCSGPSLSVTVPLSPVPLSTRLKLDPRDRPAFETLDRRASKERLHTGSIGGLTALADSPHRRGMSAYYSARIASPTPIASHRPTASPTMSHLPLSLMVILPARQLGQHHHLAVERYWDAERVLGEATFDHRSVPPRRFSRPTREAASCVPLRTDQGPLSPSVNFPWAN